MMGDRCGGRVQCSSVASQFVTIVMGVFAPWSSGGDPATDSDDFVWAKLMARR